MCLPTSKQTIHRTKTRNNQQTTNNKQTNKQTNKQRTNKQKTTNNKQTSKQTTNKQTNKQTHTHTQVRKARKKNKQTHRTKITHKTVINQTNNHQINSPSNKHSAHLVVDDELSTIRHCWNEFCYCEALPLSISFHRVVYRWTNDKVTISVENVSESNHFLTNEMLSVIRQWNCGS